MLNLRPNEGQRRTMVVLLRATMADSAAHLSRVHFTLCIWWRRIDSEASESCGSGVTTGKLGWQNRNHASVQWLNTDGWDALRDGYAIDVALARENVQRQNKVIMSGLHLFNMARCGGNDLAGISRNMVYQALPLLRRNTRQCKHETDNAGNAECVYGTCWVNVEKQTCGYTSVARCGGVRSN